MAEKARQAGKPVCLNRRRAAYIFTNINAGSIANSVAMKGEGRRHCVYVEKPVCGVKALKGLPSSWRRKEEKRRRKSCLPPLSETAVCVYLRPEEEVTGCMS